MSCENWLPNDEGLGASTTRRPIAVLPSVTTTAENDFAGNLVIVRGAVIQARLEASRASTVLNRGSSEKRGIARRALVNGVWIVTPATYRTMSLLDTVTRFDTK